MSRPEAAFAALPGLPRDVDGPVFAAPWQAQAFALTVALHERGLFSWREWTEALGRELHAPGACADGSDYYERWLKALENLVVDKKLTSPITLAARAFTFTNPGG